MSLYVPQYTETTPWNEYFAGMLRQEQAMQHITIARQANALYSKLDLNSIPFIDKKTIIYGPVDITVNTKALFDNKSLIITVSVHDDMRPDDENELPNGTLLEVELSKKSHVITPYLVFKNADNPSIMQTEETLKAASYDLCAMNATWTMLKSNIESLFELFNIKFRKD